MRIQNNITAMNTHRMYTSNNNAITKSAEKLSSGYRINRAGDDAAGLAISEKMRSQIRGLNMASKNSQDANSLIQTAEGALQEVHSMLQRMNELANQSATGTNENFDRTQISAEFDQLKNEINDISEQTNFNNMKLLDGSLASGAAKATCQAGTMKVNGSLGTGVGALTITAQTGLSDQIGSYTISATAAAGAPTLKASEVNIAFTDAKTGNTTNTVVDLSKVTSGDFANNGSFKLDLSSAGMGTFEMTAGSSAGTVTALKTALTAATLTTANATDTAIQSGLPTATATSHAALSFTGKTGVTAGEYRLSFDSTASTVSLLDSKGNAVAGTSAVAVTDGTASTATNQSLNFGTGYDLGSVSVASGTTAATKAEIGAALSQMSVSVANSETSGGALKIQVGANEGQQLDISVEKMNVDGLGLTNSKIDTQEKAGSAITATQTAINLVSEQRSTLGAMQNRLEHKISNLDNTSENLSASESRIRDVDIAKEMTAFTKNQILSQAATAMLAQANSLPQNVLSLMQ